MYLQHNDSCSQSGMDSYYIHRTERSGRDHIILWDGSKRIPRDRGENDADLMINALIRGSLNEDNYSIEQLGAGGWHQTEGRPIRVRFSLIPIRANGSPMQQVTICKDAVVPLPKIMAAGTVCNFPSSDTIFLMEVKKIEHKVILFYDWKCVSRAPTIEIANDQLNEMAIENERNIRPRIG